MVANSAVRNVKTTVRKEEEKAAKGVKNNLSPHIGESSTSPSGKAPIPIAIGPETILRSTS